MISFDLPLLTSFAAAGMLLATFVLVSRMRLTSFLFAFRAQSLFLALYATLIAFNSGELHLLIIAVLVVALKVVMLPYLLSAVAQRSGAALRLESFLRPATLSFAGAVAIVFGFIIAEALAPAGQAPFFIGVSLSLLLAGFLLLIARKDLFAGTIGFLVMENGIFTFGLALVGGMPLLVEIGIFFDVMISFILMVTILYRVQHEHASLATEDLTELTD